MTFVFLENVPVNAGYYALYVAVAFLSGIAVGAVGVGGVFLVPTLIVIGIDARIAIMAVMASFFPVALIHAIFAIRGNKIDKKAYGILSTGLVFGSGCAAGILTFVPIFVITVIVSIVAFGSGAKTLFKLVPVMLYSESKNIDSPSNGNSDGDITAQNNGQADVESIGQIKLSAPSPGSQRKLEDSHAPYSFDAQKMDQPKLFFIGIISGFFSVLTGTGGPFAILPCFFVVYENIPANDAVSIAVAAGAVISLTSTIVNGISSTVDLGIGLTSALALGCGMPLGTYIGDKVSKNGLKVAISVILVILGIYTLVNMLLK